MLTCRAYHGSHSSGVAPLQGPRDCRAARGGSEAAYPREDEEAAPSGRRLLALARGGRGRARGLFHPRYLLSIALDTQGLAFDQGLEVTCPAPQARQAAQGLTGLVELQFAAVEAVPQEQLALAPKVALDQFDLGQSARGQLA